MKGYLLIWAIDLQMDGTVADGGAMAKKPSSSPVIYENDIERPILYGEDTGT